MSSHDRDIKHEVSTPCDNERLPDLFTEASELKKNTLNRLATQFARKAPEFYQKYQAAATVIYRSRTKTSAPTPEVEA